MCWAIPFAVAMPEGANGKCWSVYIVRCRHNSLYTGIATDVTRRVQEHRDGMLGARYLRGRAPLKLVGQWAVGDRSTALRVERRIKRLDKKAKERLLACPKGIAEFLLEIRPGGGAAFAEGPAEEQPGC